MTDALYVESIEFMRAVAALRGMAPRFRSLAHHAADFWSDEEFLDRMLAVKIPDNEIQGTLQ